MTASRSLAAAYEHHRASRFDQAEREYRDLLAENPADANVLHLLGILAHQTGRNAQALEFIHQAISLNPNVSAFHCNLGMILAKLNNFPPAIRSFERAIQLQPDSADAYANLSNVYKQMGEVERALDLAQRALSLKKDPQLASNLLYLMNFHPAYNTQTIAAALRGWRRTFADPLKPLIRPHTNTRDPARPLKLGFILPILADNPALRFLLSYLEHFTAADFHINCYYGLGAPSATNDPITRSLLSLPVVCKRILGLDDNQAADLIRADQIDILFDLSMHTEDNRLLLFAQKPAPVQISYLAYPGTTGLDTIDYRLTDPYLDPPGVDPSLYSETSIYLETYFCYRPPPEATPVSPLPAANSGHITFGCLNNHAKVTGHVLEVWSRILKAVAHSRIHLYCPQGPCRDRALRTFADASVAPSRVTLLDPMPTATYFAQYNHIDIALDPFPHAGGTTTCDALWMGVPVVTLGGNTPVSRAGVSILSNAGATNLVSDTLENYQRLAVRLTSDPRALATLRSNLRNQIQSSPLADALRFTKTFERVLRQVWLRYCQTQ